MHKHICICHTQYPDLSLLELESVKVTHRNTGGVHPHCIGHGSYETFPRHIQYLQFSKSYLKIIKILSVHLRTPQDPLSILKDRDL